MLKGPGTKEWSAARRTNADFTILMIQKPVIRFSEDEGHLPVFAQEKKISKTQGANEYIASGYDLFWRHYRRMTPRDRRHYEIMLVDLPTNLHVDFEFYLGPNPEADPDEVVAEFNDRVMRLLIELGYVKGPEEVRIIDLSSSKPTKCSHHLLFKIRDGTAMFKNNYQCGAFVRRLAARAAIDKTLYFRPEKAETDGEKTSFVADMAIYSMHRVFRIIGSSKYSGLIRPLVSTNETLSKEEIFDALARKTPKDRDADILEILRDGYDDPSHAQGSHDTSILEKLRALFSDPPFFDALFPETPENAGIIRKDANAEISKILRDERRASLDPEIFEVLWGSFSKESFFDSLAQKTPEYRNVETLICLEEDGCEPVSQGNRGVRTSPGFSTKDLPMRSIPDDDVFDAAAPPCARAIAEAVRRLWDPEQRFDFKWYNSRTKVIRISSTSRRCRAKELYTEGKETHHSQNHIYCDVSLRSKTFYQACYSEKNSEHHPCRLQNGEGHFMTIPSEDIALPATLHESIDKFLEGERTSEEYKKELAEAFVECTRYCALIPNEERV